MAQLKSTSITGNLAVTGNITGKFPASSTTQVGVVQLNDATNSTSTTQAATANAVKKVQDGLNNKVSTGKKITLTGDVTGSGTLSTTDLSIATTVANDSHDHTQLIGKNAGAIIMRDFGNGNVVISASKSPEGNIGDLILGYNPSGSSTYFTKSIRLESSVNWKGSSNPIINSSGKVEWAAITGVPNAAGLGAVPLAGGTMTGPLVLKNTTIQLNNGTDTVDIIKGLGGNNTGQGVAFGGGALTIIGSGESQNSIHTNLNIANTAEKLILSSDNEIYFATACNTIANRKVGLLSNEGNLHVAGAMYVASNAGTGGTSYSRVYAQNYKPTPADIGAAAASHTHSYVATNSGTATDLVVDKYLKFGDYDNTNTVNTFLRGGVWNTSFSDIKIGSNTVYHTGRKPTPADIGAAAIAGGKKIFCQTSTPSATSTGDLWIKW